MKKVIKKILGTIGGLVIMAFAGYVSLNILINLNYYYNPHKWIHVAGYFLYEILAGGVLWMGVQVTGDSIFSSDRGKRIVRFFAMLSWIILSGYLIWGQAAEHLCRLWNLKGR